MAHSKLPLLLLSTFTVLGVAGCGDKDGTTPPDDTDLVIDDTEAQGGDPLLAITSPAFDQEFDASALQLTFTVQNFTVTDKAGEAAVDGEGHYHLVVDGTYRDFGTDPSSAWATRLGAGEHDLSVELVGNDHTPLDPVVSDTVVVKITEGSPYVGITHPTYKQSINSSSWPVSVDVTDFQLVDKLGQGNATGQGHYHVYVDDVLQADTADAQTWVQDQSPGDHILMVKLAENDHSERDTSFDYQRVSSPEDRPGIAITSPPNGEIVSSDFNVTIDHENFELAPNSVGQAAEPGKGHWHVFVDGAYFNYSTDGTVSVEGVSNGEHTLRVELYNNDHTELSERVFFESRVVVQ